MTNARRLLLTLLVTLSVATLFTWPLPTLVTDGIASSGRNVEQPPARAMIAGDHLQLLYQFWLFGDMLRGHTPFWHNVYEFNNIKTKDFPLLSEGSTFTDDTVCTVAVAEALLDGTDVVASLRTWCDRYPEMSYGLSFMRWLCDP